LTEHRPLRTTTLLLLAALASPAAAQISPAWIQRYSGPAGDSDSASDLALDPQGNVYVTGVSGTFLSDIATIKYDSSGQQLWVRTFDGPGHRDDSANRIVVKNDAVYIAGYSIGSGTGYDFITIKYDTSGNQLWAARHNGTGNEEDRAVGLSVDDAGFVYITGTSRGTTTQTDIVTIKYSPQGQPVWVRAFDGPAHQIDQARDLRVNAAGDVYVCGRISTVGDWDAVALKYNSAGTLIWSRTFSTPGAPIETPETLAIDSSGDIILAGSSGSFTFADLLVLKYSPAGDLRWSRRFHGPSTTGADSAYGLAIDDARNIYIAGQTFGPDYNLATTIAYDPDGQIRWLDRHDPGGPAAADHLTLDASGAVYVAARFDPQGADPLDALILKYHAGPTIDWTYTFAGALNFVDIIRRVAVTPEGRVFAAGMADFGPLAEVGDFLTINLNQPVPCYPNCDNSTSSPTLTSNDFQCFLNKFATQDPSANCDHSTNPPTLNANDFQCFLNAFASGCP